MEFIDLTRSRKTRLDSKWRRGRSENQGESVDDMRENGSSDPIGVPNGSVRDNTDAEGRLVLAGVARDIALGEVYSGVFTTSDTLWNRLSTAGESEYDRFWRMPLDEDYGPQQ
ncbi:hypothetical protein AZE42_12371 [Rhizopogon vesiculosus]|uniref:Cytosol aminopeptidase domain-containing protein n=1 Tax=Rhizopogon vesiculosus TaxID=180088 RepID=A0A1J8QE52_9AGAM|nr:hypothetical protein AZE42_12371 [Rhizopogon vesiculosus]